jgi:hypothetical protein
MLAVRWFSSHTPGADDERHDLVNRERIHAECRMNKAWLQVAWPFKEAPVQKIQERYHKLLAQSSARTDWTSKQPTRHKKSSVQYKIQLQEAQIDFANPRCTHDPQELCHSATRDTQRTSTQWNQLTTCSLTILLKLTLPGCRFVETPRPSNTSVSVGSRITMDPLLRQDLSHQSMLLIYVDAAAGIDLNWFLEKGSR